MSAITLLKSNPPTQGFRWKIKGGRGILPEQMATQHLFNTISMIWNHFMPEDAATHSYAKSEFDLYYADEYMAKAILTMLPELLTRPLTPFQESRLLYMYNYLKRRGIFLQEPQKELSHGFV